MQYSIINKIEYVVKDQPEDAVEENENTQWMDKQKTQLRSQQRAQQMEDIIRSRSTIRGRNKKNQIKTEDTEEE